MGCVEHHEQAWMVWGTGVGGGKVKECNSNSMIKNQYIEPSAPPDYFLRYKYHNFTLKRNDLLIYFLKSSPEGIFNDLRKRKGKSERKQERMSKRERERWWWREKYWSIASHMHPNQGSNLQLRYVPSLGIEPITFWCMDDTPTNLLSWPGLISLFLTVLWYSSKLPSQTFTEPLLSTEHCFLSYHQWFYEMCVMWCYYYLNFKDEQTWGERLSDLLKITQLTSDGARIFLKYIYSLCYYSCPISPPSLHSILHTPSLPHSPPIVHVHGSYL